MIELYLISAFLQYRLLNRTIFDVGRHAPLEAEGERAFHACAVARVHDDAAFIAACLQRFVSLVGPGVLPFGKNRGKNTRAVLSGNGRGGTYRHSVTGKRFATIDHNGRHLIDRAERFASLSVAVLKRTA